MSHPEDPKGDDVEPTEGNGVAEEAPAEEAAPAEEPENPLQAELDATRADLDAASAQVRDLTAKLRAVSKAYSDLQQDNQAFMERTRQQSTVLADKRAAELVEKFFEPVQNLKRSLAAAAEDDPFADGIRMVLHQLQETLKRLGLEEVPGEGAVFDPEIHEALAVTPVTDPALDGRVLDVYNTGYRVKGRTLQAAQVVIGKHEAPATEPTPDAAQEGGNAPEGEAVEEGNGEA